MTFHQMATKLGELTLLALDAWYLLAPRKRTLRDPNC